MHHRMPGVTPCCIAGSANVFTPSPLGKLLTFGGIGDSFSVLK